MLKLNVKVIRLKLFLAEADIDFEAMPRQLDITSNRWNWLINEKVEEDRLAKMNPIEVILLARAVGKRPEDLAQSFGLGNPRWVKSLVSVQQAQISGSDVFKSADLSLPATVV